MNPVPSVAEQVLQSAVSNPSLLNTVQYVTSEGAGSVQRQVREQNGPAAAHMAGEVVRVGADLAILALEVATRAPEMVSGAAGMAVETAGTAIETAGTVVEVAGGAVEVAGSALEVVGGIIGGLLS